MITAWVIWLLLYLLSRNGEMKIKEYDIAKIIVDVYNYQRNEIDTYKIIILIETILVILLSCELAWRHLLG